MPDDAKPYSGLAISVTKVQAVRDDRVETLRVEVGLLDKDIVEIRDGLAEADVVVDHADAVLREGDRVRPVPAARVTAQ